jgi:hypothetical protein
MEHYAFWFKNTPSEFQNIMNDILTPFSDFSIVYIDDVLSFDKIYRTTLETFKYIRTNYTI